MTSPVGIKESNKRFSGLCVENAIRGAKIGIQDCVSTYGRKKTSHADINIAHRHLVLGVRFIGDERGVSQIASLPKDSSKPTAALQPNTLCDRNERVIFRRPIKRPAKIVFLCASKDVTSDRGYLQYRFGLPGD